MIVKANKKEIKKDLCSVIELIEKAIDHIDTECTKEVNETIERIEKGYKELRLFGFLIWSNSRKIARQVWDVRYGEGYILEDVKCVCMTDLYFDELQSKLNLSKTYIKALSKATGDTVEITEMDAEKIEDLKGVKNSVIIYFDGHGDQNDEKE